MTEKQEQLIDNNQNYLHKNSQLNFDFQIINPAPPIVIDLTEEDEDVKPPTKRVVVTNNGRGESSFLDRHDEDQAGPSRLVHKSPRGENTLTGCMRCLMNNRVKPLISLKCDHRFCYNCFTAMLNKNRNPINNCFHNTCNYQITDVEIKNFLENDDYILFLEHSRDVLRKKLHLSHLELEFVGAQYVDGPEEVPLTHQSNKDDVIFVEEAVTQLPRLRSTLISLRNLENMSFVNSSEVFECPVCITDIDIGKGVTLKDCLHNLCLDCFRQHVQMCEDPLVPCPATSCEFFIQEREIRGIVSEEIYNIHIEKGMKRAETALENIYHCKTPDCVGFVQDNVGSNAFLCAVCNKVNCTKCKMIHEDMTCEQYKADLLNDVKNQHELKLTEAAIEQMLKKGDAMLCPKCNALIQKDEGCDFVQCSACKLGICYRMKKPRMPFVKVINGISTVIDGCHCNEKGKKCHPQCKNCH